MAKTKIEYKEIYFVVWQSGKIGRQVNTRHTVDYLFASMGNVFKTEAEAKANRKEIMEKYQDLRDRGLV
nr:MAG TPA: hypothetical protein [Caudoviricetes sp.]